MGIGVLKFIKNSESRKITQMWRGDWTKITARKRINLQSPERSDYIIRRNSILRVNVILFERPFP